jgi:hypothetical protein
MKNFPLNRKDLFQMFAGMLLTCSLPSIAFSQATITKTNDITPFVRTIFVPCANGGAGEFVQVTGTVHVQTHEIRNGDHVRLRINGHTQRSAGVGLITGDVYHESSMTQTSRTFTLPDGANGFTQVTTFRFIGQGTAGNFQIFEVLHLQINANGEVTAVVQNHNASCD